MRVLILGAGGQGQVIADALLFAAEAQQPLAPIGYLDDNPALWQTHPLGLPVLGPLAAWCEIPHDALILGIGTNRRRSELYAALVAQGANFVTVRHPTAVVGHDVLVGPGSYVGVYAVIAAGTTVGANAILHGNSCIGHHNVIGDHVHLAPGVLTAGNVHIGEGAMLGIGASVVPQRCIGAWATVGAATLVHRDVAPDTTVVGVPGRLLR